MTGIVAISLENEMDLILAYKKSIKTGELLGLSISTQTSFATAVSEVCREVIDKTFDGHAVIGVITEGDRFFLAANITFKEDDNLKKRAFCKPNYSIIIPFLWSPTQPLKLVAF